MLEKQVQKNILKKIRGDGVIAFKSDRPPVGWPDITILSERKEVGYLEIKRPGEKPRPVQDRRIRQIADLGYAVDWTDSVQGAVEFINSLRGKA